MHGPNWGRSFVEMEMHRKPNLRSNTFNAARSARIGSMPGSGRTCTMKVSRSTQNLCADLDRDATDSPRAAQNAPAATARAGRVKVVTPYVTPACFWISWKVGFGAKSLIYLVGAAGFEPTTPSPPDWCANRAAPRPDRNGADYRDAPIAAQPLARWTVWSGSYST